MNIFPVSFVDVCKVSRPAPVHQVHLAIAHVFAASRAAEVFDKYLVDDEDDMTQVPVYFGSPFVADDVLMRRLDVLTTCCWNDLTNKHASHTNILVYMVTCIDTIFTTKKG